MTQFEWTAELACEPSAHGPVARVLHWRCTARDGGHEGAVCGARRLGEVDPEHFLQVPGDITGAVIRAWLGGEAGQAEAAAADQLAVLAQRAAQQLLSAPAP